MPVSVYRLLNHDHDLKKLTPSQLKIGTYTTETVKILGSSAQSIYCTQTARN